MNDPIYINDPVCIRVWVRDSIPERFRHLVSLHDDDGVIVLYLAHVPAAVLAGKTYQEYNGGSQIEGWMEEGEHGLFGTNAIDQHPHPDGDGILILGSCV